MVSSHASQPMPMAYKTVLWPGELKHHLLSFMGKNYHVWTFAVSSCLQSYLKGTLFIDSCPPLAEAHAVKSIER